MKCKDYHIVRVNLRGKSDLDRWKTAEKWVHFKWDFFEKITGKNKLDYIQQYIAFSGEAMEEELRDWGIHISNGENYYTIYIPKSKYPVIDKYLAHLDLPYKILTKSYVSFVGFILNNKNNRYIRDMAEEINKKVLQKHD